MIQIMFTCDRCKRKKELVGDMKDKRNNLYDLAIYHHGDRLHHNVENAQLCPECKDELEKWLGVKE